MYTYKNLKIPGGTEIAVLCCRNRNKATAYKAVIVFPGTLTHDKAKAILSNVLKFEEAIKCRLAEIQILAKDFAGATYENLKKCDRVLPEFFTHATTAAPEAVFFVDGLIHPVCMAGSLPENIEDYLTPDAKALHTWDPEACAMLIYKGAIISVNVPRNASAAYRRYKRSIKAGRDTPAYDYYMTADTAGHRCYIKLC